jgi:2-polyprenyl-3-methyl-5-hydroxy-6-metoxy-1,4-benzoquinol methylase
VVETLYAMLFDEIAESNYSQEELALLNDPIFYYGRYLNPTTREYSIHNLVSSLSLAIRYLNLGDGNQPSLVDLGCGLGMQSFIFASLGARVLALDLDPTCIALCRKRKPYFETRLGQELKVNFGAVDFRSLDPNSLGSKYDGLFSMSAFAHIVPLRDTVTKIAALLNESGRVFIWDQNPKYLFLDIVSRRRRRLPYPYEVSSEFSKHGFRTELLGGACAIPHQFWRSGAALAATSAIDSFLKKSLRLSFNYLFAASRG